MFSCIYGWVAFGLGLGVAVGVVFGLADGLLASFLILGMSWVGGGAFVFSPGFFMGGGCGDYFCLLLCCTALVGISWTGSGVAFLGVIAGTFWWRPLCCGRFWALVAIDFCLRLLW